MASDTATDLRIERKPKLSERVVSALREQLLARRDRAGTEAADREPADRDLRRQPHRHPRGDRHACRRRAGRVAPGRRRLRHASTPRWPSARSAADIGSKISQALNVLEVRMGIEIESAGLAAHPPQQRAGGRDPGGLLRVRAAARHRASRPARPTSPSIGRSPSPPTIRSMSRCSTRSARAPFPATSPRPGAPNSVLTREYQDGLQREHLVILNAISAGDAEAARDAMRAHLTASQERYRERLRGQQAEYFAGSAKPRQPTDQ